MAHTRKARIAPTPSGYLHEGNVANFLLNAALAGVAGELLLRIDDLDRGRYRRVYVEDIFRVLQKLDISITEGPGTPEEFEGHWSQENRMGLYREALDRLRGQPHVFACPCSRQELAGGRHPHGCLGRNLDLDAPGVAWRINTRAFPDPLVIPDMTPRAPFVVDLHRTVPDFAVRARNGRPSYQLACTVDDLHFGVTHVGRGQDLLGSTAAQIILADLLGEEPLLERIAFLHHPLLPAPGGGKLSKSAGHGGEGLVLTDAVVTELRSLAESWMTPSE